MGIYSKAIMAFITGLVGVVGQFIDLTWATPELIAALTTILATVAVYAIPNQE